MHYAHPTFCGVVWDSGVAVYPLKQSSAYHGIRAELPAKACHRHLVRKLVDYSTPQFLSHHHCLRILINGFPDLYVLHHL